MQLYLAVAAFCLQIYSGYFLQMMSEPQRFVVNEGESVVLVCDFHADHYNLFDYPVLWKKSQLDEDTRVNIMGNINVPFVDTGKIEVAYSPTPPRYQLELFVTGVTAEDSGNYTCEVRGPKSVILGHVTHEVIVRVPVENVYITGGNLTTGPSQRLPRTLTVIENTENSVRCVAHGGFPPALPQIKIGRRDLTDIFKLSIHTTKSGMEGLRVLSYITERWTNSFRASADDDQRKLKCAAIVLGLDPVTTFIRLNVHYAPKIVCYPRGANIGDVDAHVRCEIRAKPEVTAMFWILDGNETTLSEGDVINGYWTLTVNRSDNVLASQLYMRRVSTSSFKTYTLVAENSVAVSQTTVELFQTYKATPEQPLNDATVKQSSKQGRSNTRGYTYYTSTSSRVTSREVASHVTVVVLLVICLDAYLVQR